MKKIILFYFSFILLINTVSALETYTDKENGFKIVYPSGWSFSKDFETGSVNLENPSGYAAVTVAFAPTGILGLYDIAAINGAGWYGRDIIINNLKGVEWKKVETDYNTNVVYERKYVILISGDKYYKITASSPQNYYATYSDTYDEIINSFEITTKPTPTPKITVPLKTPTPVDTIVKPSASVQLYGEKTDAVLGEDIILKLSAVNVIPNPVMTVQVILIPPSGMSVTSSEFVTSGAGQYTTLYKLDPGNGKDIEVRIKANQIGNFEINGRIAYFYGDNTSTKEDYTLTLPIKVRPGAESTESKQVPREGETPKTPGFVSVMAIVSILATAHMFRGYKERR
ncbi:MAG: hypothetical protein O8C62_09385 [Candidatus Methanoperedens sp.]|nr:hypothetical protein [Candidatus Methanoperedens sp.]